VLATKVCSLDNFLILLNLFDSFLFSFALAYITSKPSQIAYHLA